MKSWLPSIVTMLLVCAAAAFAGPSPHDPADTFAFNSVPQIEQGNHPEIPDSSNDQVLLDSSSLIVLTSGGELFSQPVSEPPPGLLPAKFTEPQQIKPVSTVAKKAAPAATGHWETRYAGFRGRRSYSVWVPDNPTGATSANGSCSSGACANGSLPGYFYGSGGCRSCR